MASRPANKSLHSAAYEHYLRTGEQMSTREWLQRYERKFNPYHDPKNGQFTFGPGGASLGQSARGVSKVPTRNSRAMSQHQVEAHADHAMDQYHRERARGKSPEEAAAWAANSEAESGGVRVSPKSVGAWSRIVPVGKYDFRL